MRVDLCVGFLEILRQISLLLQDIEPIDLSRLLQYMYQGEVRLPNNEMENFIRAANDLSIRGLCNLPKPAEQPIRPLSPCRVDHLQQPEPETARKSPQIHRPKKHALKRKLLESTQARPRSAQTPISGTSGKENYSEQKRKSTDEVSKKSPRPAEVLVKLEEAEESGESLNSGGGVSPPPLDENVVPIIQEDPLALTVSRHSLFSSSSSSISSSSVPPRILPPNEPRKSGTCYFCKKAFMKNKQLMNHICPKKPRLDGNGT